MTDDFLEWPFFDDRHRALARELERWCAAELAPLSMPDAGHRTLSRALALGEG